jgi:hypothetical protein
MSAGVSSEDELAARWRSREWLDEATAWLDQRLGRLGMERSGEVGQPHLEVFDDLASHATLVEQFDAACRLAKVGRAVLWDRSPGAIRCYLAERAIGGTGI